MTSRGRVEVVNDPDAVADRAAALIERLAAERIGARGRVVLALAGGSTPRATYERVARRDAIDWARVHLVWSDERCVPPDDAASNFRMARESLLDRVTIPSGHIHRIRGEDPPGDEATRYERVLHALLGDGAIDLAILGVGIDGHTASLFPGEPADATDVAWVRAVAAVNGREPRITLTPRALTAARVVLFLATGAEKVAAVAAAVEGPDDSRLAAQRIAHAARDVRWVLDRTAARLLTAVSSTGA